MGFNAKISSLSTTYLALFCSLLVSAIYFLWPYPFESLDFRIYDLKMRFRDDGSVQKSIVHLDVDDRSVREFGLWPWNRELSATIVDRLSQAGAKLIVFDILFSAQGRNPQGNEALFQALSSSSRVVSATGLGVADSGEMLLRDESDPARTDALYKRAWALQIPESARFYRVTRLSNSLVPLPSILENSKSIGHIKSTADVDGVHRRVSLLVKFEDKCIPSLSLAALAAYFDITQSDVAVTDKGEISLKHPGGILSIPVDRNGRMLINWHQPWQSFAHYSASEILGDRVDPTKLRKYKDKIVLVAVTATGTSDIGLCPLSAECPLSRVHSNAINTMLTETFIRSISPFPFLLPAAILLSVGFGFLAPRIRLLYSVSLLTGIGLSCLLFSFLVFVRSSYEIPVVAPLTAFILAGTAALVSRGISTERNAFRTSEALQRYLSPQMLDKIINERKEIDLATKRKELTILFADIEGFSSISETVEVEYLEKFLNEFFEAMTRSIFEHSGTVNKFLGDGLLAFFGDPLPVDNHALAAIKAGSRMHEEMLRLNSIWSETGIPEFAGGIRLRIGINSGLVVVGNIGSKQRMEYTVLGSAVNIASRLQSLAAPNGTIISGRTYALARDKIKCSKARNVKVKGIEREVTVYEVESVVGS